THLLNNFLSSTAYQNVVFTWVMHEKSIIDDILSRLHLDDVRVFSFSLVSSEEALIKRLTSDIQSGIRSGDIIERSIQRIPLYKNLPTIKIDTSEKTPDEAASEIIQRIES
ncbi:MAG: nucleotide kinase, partial [Clostridia bacterium]|nr:nucleotide kinase [Clostridia bacterium]